MEFTTESDVTTHFLESQQFKNLSRQIADSLQIIIGVLMVSYNLFVITCFIFSQKSKSRCLRKRLSFSVLAFMVFSIYHGFVYSLVTTMKRRYRETLSIHMCIFSNLIVELSDFWFIFLIALVAIEQSLIVVFPMMKKSKLKIVVIVLLIIFTIAAALLSWVPMIPGVVATGRSYQSSSRGMKARLSTYWKTSSCNGRLNLGNTVTPIIRLVLQLLCAIIIMAVAIACSIIGKVNLCQQNHLSPKKEKNIKKAATNVLIAAILIVALMLPYSVSEIMRKNCKSIFSEKSMQNKCSAVMLELRFPLRILFHAACFVASAMYTLTDRDIRVDLTYYLTSGKYGRLDEDQKDLVTNTNTMIQTTTIKLEHLPHSTV